MNSKGRDEAESKEVIVQTACTHDCGGRCPLRLHIKDGMVVRVEGVTEGEGSQYRPCLRGRATRQILYDPERIRYPMMRTGERGEGKFQRISWDEALDKVASELVRVREDYGNPAIFLMTVGGSSGILHGWRAGARLLHMFGGCTWVWGNVSNMAAVFAGFFTYGTYLTGNTRDDHLNSRLIIMWGWNPVDTFFGTGTSMQLMKAKEAGTRFVCVDPRFTNSAAVFADEWIPIIPGTDTAMLLAMAYTIISEGLQDQKYLDTYTAGFNEFREHVMGTEDGVPKTPEWAEPITGVPADTIVKLARQCATAKPTAIIAGWGPGRTSWGEQFHRATMALAAITGNVGVHGGNAPGWEMGSLYPQGMQHLPTGTNPIVDRGPKYWIPGFKEGSTTRIQYCEMWDAILDGTAGGYPVDLKLGYVMCGNHLNQLANANRGVEALKRLEFIVVHERYMTATARFADILLPINTFVEREDIVPAWAGGYLLYAGRCLDSMYESKTDFEICSELAPRLGIKDYNDKTDEEWLRALMRDCKDIPDFDQFKEKGVHVFHLKEPHVAFKQQIEDPQNHPFPTPSGKIEIYSQRLADLNHPELPPVPKYIETVESRNDPLARKYPLQIINSHMRRRAHAQFDSIPWLKDTEPQALWLNPIDARARGVIDGDHVRVFNDRGAMIIPCWVTERIMPGVVHLAEGGPFLPDENGTDRGGCANVFTKAGYTPGGAFAGNTALIQVVKA